LDKTIGKGNYLVFLTADHGAAHAKGFLQENKMPTGIVAGDLKQKLESYLDKQFSSAHLVVDMENYQVYFNKILIDSLKLDFDKIKTSTIAFLEKQEGIQYVIDQEKIAEAPVPTVLKEKMINGYNRDRSGSILVILKSGWLTADAEKGTTHGVWNAYDTHIPLLFMGWNVPHGSTNRPVYMADIAATVAAMLHIQMPSACIGNPILELSGK
jgi:arylsulfatase A-like enzyme